MIFSPKLAEAILRGEKTVTRRPVKYAKSPVSGRWLPVPCRYSVGGTYAVQPTVESGPDKGRGGKEIGRIRILSVTEEELGQVEWREARREGCQDFSEFRRYWWKFYGGYDPSRRVHRIEFEPVEP